MDLFGVLRLAMTLEVNLATRGGRIAAAPKENLTPELREGINENRNELLEHLLFAEDHELYALLCEVAACGVDLKAKDGKLVARPMKALKPEAIEGLREYKAAVVTMLEDRELGKTGVIQCERQVVDVAKEVLA